MFTNCKKVLIPLSKYRRYSDTKSVLQIIEKGQIGQKVFVKGWIKSIRKQKTGTFLDFNDGSTMQNLQLVILHSLDTKISVGSSVSATGVLQKSPKGQNEITADKVKLVGECDLAKGYPFAPRKSYEPKYIREYLHLRPRTRKFASLLRIRHAATLAIHQYLDKNGYFNIHTPIITSNDCEGAGEIFKVMPDNEQLKKSMVKENQPLDSAYFDGKAYLTVSGQLHLEAAAHSLNKVYCFGPTFRAENSRSRLHLSEFYMLELEQAFMEKLDDLLDIVEDLVKNVTTVLLQNNQGDIEMCRGKKLDDSWVNKEFVRIQHSEALDILTNKLNKVVKPNVGISKEHELALTEYFENVPVFVTNWPLEEKPFYMKGISNNKVAAFDLLAPNIGEIAGGSLRENDYDQLKSKISSSNPHLEWYLDLRKFGSVPTGGFGLGFERYIQFILGIDSIKDCIPFPRWPHNCSL
ncbi:probable asparagine--tRNA ligase, mitochondrial [Anthonomus grandis grandis]|uniref:probable asparagine--tRNA ligase, mitochondrial n=1 Tax=Anthonomus grandis grandis TaxID=2921223 RepID=UPI002165630D|nr:probable asparagine--tRNA ligase, mitochondrial [Anthonomus grandis grandis]